MTEQEGCALLDFMHEEYGTPKNCSRIATCQGTDCLHPTGRTIAAKFRGNYITRQDIEQNRVLSELEDERILKLILPTPQV